jgi:hypothetical protein
MRSLKNKAAQPGIMKYDHPPGAVPNKHGDHLETIILLADCFLLRKLKRSAFSRTPVY